MLPCSCCLYPRQCTAPCIPQSTSVRGLRCMLGRGVCWLTPGRLPLHMPISSHSLLAQRPFLGGTPCRRSAHGRGWFLGRPAVSSQSRMRKAVPILGLLVPAHGPNTGCIGWVWRPACVLHWLRSYSPKQAAQMLGGLAGSTAGIQAPLHAAVLAWWHACRAMTIGRSRGQGLTPLTSIEGVEGGNRRTMSDLGLSDARNFLDRPSSATGSPVLP